jgi:HEAT repeats/PBS lyase HEAT-like repeat
VNGTGNQTGAAGPGENDGRSDLKVVLQFFIVPLSLVIVLVSVFFGLQIMRAHRPDAASSIKALQNYEGFLARYVGDIKRWQSGYDLSLLMRGEDAGALRRILPDLIAGFREAGAKRDLKLRRYLALALGSSADPGAIAPLREGLVDPDPETRIYACWGLGTVGTATVLPDLRRAAIDPDPGVRKAAIFQIGRLGDQESRPILRAALEDGQSDVGWNAALALARLGDAAATPLLIRLLDDSTSPVSGETESGAAARRNRALNAVRGLALLRARDARASLELARERADALEVKEAARLALESIGVRGAAAAP